MKKNRDSQNNKSGSSVDNPQQASDSKAKSDEVLAGEIKSGASEQELESGIEHSPSDPKEQHITSQSESVNEPVQKSIKAIEPEIDDAPKEQVAPDKEKPVSDEQQADGQPQATVARRKFNITGSIAILLVILLAIVGYYFYLQLSVKLNAGVDRVTELSTQQLAKNDKKQQTIATQLLSAQRQISDLSSQVASSGNSVTLLQDKLLELSGRRPNDWLLAEANYLVKLAGRKLWQEKDQQTASSLLATADLRIAEMNDPSLISLRKAFAKDIAALQSLPKDQTESIALRIDGLISQVDNLKLNTVKLPEPSEDAAGDELSASPSDWQENINKTWQSFLDGFITVRRRSSSVEPLMSPKQQWYLEENLKSKLIQTQLALYRQQQDAFGHAIELSTRWVMQFYDRKDSTTEFMLKEFSQLQQLKIDIEYPTQFYSSDLLYAELTRRSIATSNGQGR